MGGIKGTDLMKPFPLSAKIDIATAATHAIVPAQGAGKRIAIYAIFMKAAGTVTVTYKDGATAISGAIPQAVNSGEVISFPEHSPLLLSANSAFNLTLSGAIQVSGFVVWRPVVD